MRSAGWVAASYLLAVWMAWAQTGKHAFTVDDWAALHSASSVAVAPDGATILWKASWGGEKGPTHQEWRLIGADGTNPRNVGSSRALHSVRLHERRRVALWFLSGQQPSTTGCVPAGGNQEEHAIAFGGASCRHPIGAPIARWIALRHIGQPHAARRSVRRPYSG